ncbi:MAG: ankyrin repeat domain-containing protein [Gammaproteobacteria bacterium]|nr:ankyrin repeat domain-containing protein [Gammaproteobacteria bacterium]
MKWCKLQAIIAAEQNGHVEVARFLLDKFAGFFSENLTLDDAMHIAIYGMSSSNKDMRDLLSKMSGLKNIWDKLSNVVSAAAKKYNKSYDLCWIVLHQICGINSTTPAGFEEVCKNWNLWTEYERANTQRFFDAYNGWLKPAICSGNMPLSTYLLSAIQAKVKIVVAGRNVITDDDFHLSNDSYKKERFGINVTDAWQEYVGSDIGLACATGNKNLVELLLTQVNLDLASPIVVEHIKKEMGKDGSSVIAYSDNRANLYYQYGRGSEYQLMFKGISASKQANKIFYCYPLFLLCFHGWTDLVEEWRESRFQNGKLYVTDPLGRNALMAAVLGGQVETANYLFLKLGFDKKLDAVDVDGNSALLLAASRGDSDMIKMLLQYSANLLEKNTQGEDAITLAIKSGNSDAAILLIDKLEQRPSVELNWYLSEAVVVGDNKIVSHLLLKVTEINQDQGFLRQALEHISDQNCCEALLKKMNLSSGIVSHDMLFPVVAKGWMNVFNKLIPCVSRPHSDFDSIENTQGDTLLHHIAKHGDGGDGGDACRAMVDYLRQNITDSFDALNKANKTPLEVANDTMQPILGDLNASCNSSMPTIFSC